MNGYLKPGHPAFHAMRYLLIAVAGFLYLGLLYVSFALLGGGHGTAMPFLAAIVVGLPFGLSLAAIARRDAPSLRNALLLAVVFNLLILLTLGRERHVGILAPWLALWFGWQILCWGAWLALRGQHTEKDDV